MIRIAPKFDIDTQNAFRDVEQEISDLKRMIEALKTGTGQGTSVPEDVEDRLPDDKKVFVASGDQHAVGLVPDPGATAGTSKYLREDATWAIPTGYIRTGGNVPNPVAAKNWHVFRAPVACTVSAIYAIHAGGTSCTVNVRKNGSSTLRSSDYTTTTSWASFGTLQNTSLAAGDYLEIQIVTVTGAVDQVAIQVDMVLA